MCVCVQVEHSKERYSILETHHKALKTELDTLREQNRQLTNALASHQDRITHTTEELFSVKDKLARAEVSYQGLRSSYSLLEAAEKQARLQYQNMLKEQRGHGELLANLHSIQNNMEKSEFETKTRLGAQLQAAERELSLTKDSLHAEEDRRNKLMDAYNTQVRKKCVLSLSLHFSPPQ